MLIEATIMEAFPSRTIWFGMKKAERRANIKAALIEWGAPTPTPVIDGVLLKMSGSAETLQERHLSPLVVAVVRNTVNRKAFQYFVESIVNDISGLQNRFPFLQKIGSKEAC